MNMMEVCLCGNWMCAQDKTWRFSGDFLGWMLVGRCSGVFGWKIPDVPQLGKPDRSVVGK